MKLIFVAIFAMLMFTVVVCISYLLNAYVWFPLAGIHATENQIESYAIWTSTITSILYGLQIWVKS